MRIARACYYQFELGLSKAEVEQYRNELYKKLVEGARVEKSALASGHATKDPVRPSGQKAHEEATDTKGGKAPAEAASTKKKEEAKAEASPPADGTGIVTDDAPPGSAAHQRVRHEAKKNCCVFSFRREDGGLENFQTTIGAAGGSLEQAMRIARACYHKFELGLSKAEVEQYRNELYQKIGAGARYSNDLQRRDKADRPSKKRRRDSASMKELSIFKQLREQGRLKGALRVQGRDSKKKNATVNGIYAPVAEGFEGTMAYERISLEDGDFKRCLFFAKDKSRWKICEAIGDSRNFAFLKVTDGGRNPPSEAGSESMWTFFDGKEAGWAEDAAVRCTLVEGEDDTTAKKAKTEESTADKAKPKEDDSSDSESEGSGSVSESDASDSGSGAGGEEIAQPAATSTASTASPPQGPRQGTKRACAKMLVRARLRCQCHFSYLWDCPAAGGTAT
eukprot:TRINITY_DN7141_c0_g1_i10.p1 TRINITY_DN7141_c0_g1~~TRINITY_DN7141_c0_g1_i10.p1  ORF type:complete len:493 (-),score=118.27 TRINITY_DN7141_c0_g1_i10:47-1396(-)